MKRRKCFKGGAAAVALLALAVVLAGCGGGARGRHAASRREALEKLLAALRQVSAMARQPEAGEPAMYAPTVTRYLDDPKLNDVPDIQPLRDQWRALHRDLMDHPSAAGLTDRLDDLERRVQRLLSSEQGTGS